MVILEAIREAMREAIRVKLDFPEPRNDLGNALLAQGS
jgi:hypothetical protein